MLNAHVLLTYFVMIVEMELEASTLNGGGRRGGEGEGGSFQSQICLIKIDIELGAFMYLAFQWLLHMTSKVL